MASTRHVRIVIRVVFRGVFRCFRYSYKFHMPRYDMTQVEVSNHLSQAAYVKVGHL